MSEQGSRGDSSDQSTSETNKATDHEKSNPRRSSGNSGKRTSETTKTSEQKTSDPPTSADNSDQITSETQPLREHDTSVPSTSTTSPGQAIPETSIMSENEGSSPSTSAIPTQSSEVAAKPLPYPAEFRFPGMTKDITAGVTENVEDQMPVNAEDNTIEKGSTLSYTQQPLNELLLQALHLSPPDPTLTETHGLGLTENTESLGFDNELEGPTLSQTEQPLGELFSQLRYSLNPSSTAGSTLSHTEQPFSELSSQDSAASHSDLPNVLQRLQTTPDELINILQIATGLKQPNSSSSANLESSLRNPMASKMYNEPSHRQPPQNPLESLQQDHSSHGSSYSLSLSSFGSAPPQNSRDQYPKSSQNPQKNYSGLLDITEPGSHRSEVPQMLDEKKYVRVIDEGETSTAEEQHTSMHSIRADSHQRAFQELCRSFSQRQVNLISAISSRLGGSQTPSLSPSRPLGATAQTSPHNITNQDGSIASSQRHENEDQVPVSARAQKTVSQPTLNPNKSEKVALTPKDEGEDISQHNTMPAPIIKKQMPSGEEVQRHRAIDTPTAMVTSQRPDANLGENSNSQTEPANALQEGHCLTRVESAVQSGAGSQSNFTRTLSTSIQSQLSTVDALSSYRTLQRPSRLDPHFREALSKMSAEDIASNADTQAEMASGFVKKSPTMAVHYYDIFFQTFDMIPPTSPQANRSVTEELLGLGIALHNNQEHGQALEVLNIAETQLPESQEQTDSIQEYKQKAKHSLELAKRQEAPEI